MVSNDALFCIRQDETLRHDVVKSESCRAGSLKPCKSELCDTMSQSEIQTGRIH